MFYHLAFTIHYFSPMDSFSYDVEELVENLSFSLTNNLLKNNSVAPFFIIRKNKSLIILDVYNNKFIPIKIDKKKANRIVTTKLVIENSIFFNSERLAIHSIYFFILLIIFINPYFYFSNICKTYICFMFHIYYFLIYIKLPAYFIWYYFVY